MLKRRSTIKAATAALLLTSGLGASAVAMAPMASAITTTFSESWSGSTYISGGVNTTNTFTWTSPHGDFNERFRIDAPVLVPNTYSIQMYDSVGRQVWSASGQGDRTYFIGGNVVKIVIKSVASSGVTLKWNRS